MKTYTMSRLVKSEDLNHHGTLFAGRMAEWFVEGGFIAAASMIGDPSKIVCKKIHGMAFNMPVKKGAIINIHTKVVSVGTTSLAVYGSVTADNNHKMQSFVDGFITFVCVDEEGNKLPHGLDQPELTTSEEEKLLREAKSLK